MKFALLYKVFILSVQGKYTNCTRGVQGFHLWRISSDYEKLTCLFPSIKNGGHSSHILVNHTLIPYTLVNSYMVIWIPISIIMIVEQNCTIIFPLLLD